MTRLPERTREHVLDKQARAYVSRILPSEWIIRAGQPDYAVDLYIELVHDTQVTGAVFLIQLKGTDHLTVRKHKYIAHVCETSKLFYFLQCPAHVIYLVYDAKGDVGYWIWIQEYIRNELRPDWLDQKSITVRIPLSNVFDEKAVIDITQRVYGSHERHKWLTAIETIRNPYLKYSLSATDQDFRIDVFPKYPGAEEVAHVQFSPHFTFDQSPEGQAALQDLYRHFSTGAMVEIDARFVDDIRLPEVFSDLLAHVREFRISKVILGSAQTNVRILTKMTIFDGLNQVLAEFQYLEFKVVQAGSEEFTLSNEEQGIAHKIRLVQNPGARAASVTMSMRFQGTSVVHVREFLHIQRALARGAWVKLTNLETGLYDTGNIPANSVAEPDESLLHLFNDLAFVQEKTNCLIRWPGELNEQDAYVLSKALSAIRTGRTCEPTHRFMFTVDKAMGRNLASILQGGRRTALRLDTPDSRINLLGTELSLGACSVVLPNVGATEETLQRFQELEYLPDNSSIPIELEVEQPGVLRYYYRWLPQGSESS